MFRLVCGAARGALKGPGVTTVVTVVDRDESEPSTALTSTVTPHEIERLPVNGRRWQTFALLAPGVNPSGTDDSLLSFSRDCGHAEQL